MIGCRYVLAAAFPGIAAGIANAADVRYVDDFQQPSDAWCFGRTATGRRTPTSPGN